MIRIYQDIDKYIEDYKIKKNLNNSGKVVPVDLNGLNQQLVSNSSNNSISTNKNDENDDFQQLLDTEIKKLL